MPRIGSSSHGESHIRLLRVVRRGDRHDPRELTVSFHLEGDFAAAFRQGRGGVIPGQTLRNVVHQAARRAGAAEIEELGLAIGDRLLQDHAALSLARIDIVEGEWRRLVAGGRPQAQAFMGGTPEIKTAAITTNGAKVAVVSGLAQLALMRTSGFAPPSPASDDGTSDGLQPLFVGELSARWSYTTPDVTFRSFRQGVRAAILDTFSWHRGRSVHHTLYAIADVVLATYQEIGDVTLAIQEHPYRPADPFAAASGEDPDDLFVSMDGPAGTVEVRVEREG